MSYTKNFFLLVLGQIISLFGNAILRFALPLCLLRETNSAIIYSSITSFAMLPLLMGYLIGGFFADRYPKAKIMASLDFLTAAVCSAASFLANHAPVIPFVLLVLGLLYAVQGLYQPAVQASLPLLLKKEKLMIGNAITQCIDTVDEFLGPAIGSFLMLTLSLNQLLFLCACCFLSSAFMEKLLDFHDVPLAYEHNSAALIINDLKNTFSYITKSNRQLLSLISLLSLLNLCVIPALTVGIPILVIQYLHMSNVSLGLTQSIMGIGGFAGCILVSIFSKKLRIHQGLYPLFGMSILCFAFSITLLPVFTSLKIYYVITILAFCMMTLASLFNIWFFSYIQAMAPASQIGKVISLLTVLVCLTQPIGQTLYGVLYEILSAHPWVVLFFAGILSVGIDIIAFYIFSPHKHQTQ